MIIGICSDIHDNIWKLEAAQPGLKEADVLLFLGDFCAPFTLQQLADGFDGPVHVVFGNNDGDQRMLAQIASKFSEVTLHGEFAEVRLGGLSIALTHYPDIARGLASSPTYDVVCYGHNHTLNQEQIGDTLLLNPGELMGRFGRSTYMMLDAHTKTVTVHEVT